METKKFFNLLLLTVLAVPTVKADLSDHREAAKGFIAGLGVVVCWKMNETKKFTCLTGGDEDGADFIGKLLMLSSGLTSAGYIASYFEKKSLAKYLKKIGMEQLPKAVVATCIIERPFLESSVSRLARHGTIEEIGTGGGGSVKRFNCCPEDNCKKCEVAKITGGIALYTVIDKVIDNYRNRHGIGNKDKQ